MSKGYRLFSFLAALLVTGGLLLSAIPSEADPLLDFWIGSPTTGTIFYIGGNNPLVGAGISVDSVVGLETPINDGVTQSLSGAVLNFTTGNFVSSTSSEWVFDPGGSISIQSGTTVLLSGTLTDADVIKSGSLFKVAIGGFIDTKDPGLLAFYGLPNTAYSGNFNISFYTVGSPPNAFTSTIVLSGDVTNSPLPVPEPSLIVLLSIAGLSLAGLRTWWKE
jgi:hypothetical protein